MHHTFRNDMAQKMLNHRENQVWHCNSLSGFDMVESVWFMRLNS